MTEERTILTTAEAAEFLRLRAATLDGWRSDAKGPPYITINRNIRYPRRELEAWAFSGPILRREIEEVAECHNERRSRVKRARGRAGAEKRERRLADEPLCRDCAAAGIMRASTEVDHIVPLRLGGTDDDDNVRCLCCNCHWIRTQYLLDALANPGENNGGSLGGW